MGAPRAGVSVSLLTGHLAIPPATGVGTAVDLGIFVTGLAVSLLVGLRQAPLTPGEK